ncbi:MAG TPA: TetR/AcrR family transcriptional regulator [Kiloniellales bacterium]|jgi:AcrR family transcriptional regulator
MNRRDHLMHTAEHLFQQNGYRATGIDRILAESGVAKMTLYKYFPSKDDLVLAVLRGRAARWRAWLETAVASRAETPRERMLAVFDLFEEWFESPDFTGCLFIKAASEYGDRNDPVHQAAAEHHRNLLAYLRDLAVAARARRPMQLARQLMLLAIGATAVTQVNGPVGAGREARETAALLLAQALD